MASECVDPDAKCYRLAAEAFRDPGEEAERLLGLATQLEAEESSDNAEEEKKVEKEQEDYQIGAILNEMDLSDVSGFEMLADEADEESDDTEVLVKSR